MHFVIRLMRQNPPTSSRAAKRRGDPQDQGLDCFVGMRLLAKTLIRYFNLPRLRALFACCALIGAAVPASAAELVVDLAHHLVAITTGFTGSDVLVFGATDGEGDVVVVIRGPENTEAVRRKGRVRHLDEQRGFAFDNVPAYYAVAASVPFEDILPERVMKRHQIGVNNLRLIAPRDADPGEAEEFRAALIRSKQRAGLFTEEPSRILFSATACSAPMLLVSGQCAGRRGIAWSRSF